MNFSLLRKAFSIMTIAATFMVSPLMQYNARAEGVNTLEAFAALQGNLNIAGGTAHIGVMKDAAKIIMTAYPDIRITIAGGGSGVGVQQVGAGLVDIGNTGRPLSEAEVEKFGLVSFAFAIDGVALVLNTENTIDALTSEQVRDIFAGKISNWQELGGPNKGINLYSRDEASGTREVFVKKLLAKGPVAQSANIVASNGSMKTSIIQDPYGVGYVSIGYIDDSVKTPSIDGMIANQENAANGSYTITRKLYMNTQKDASAITKAFIDFIYSQEGAAIINKNGYLSTGK